jgi:hypothetical protein
MPAGLAVVRDFARISSIDDTHQAVLAVQEAVEKGEQSRILADSTRGFRSRRSAGRKCVRRRSRDLIAGSPLRLVSGGQEDAVLLVLSTWVAS